MNYTKFIRPNARQEDASTELHLKFEMLALKCLQHPAAEKFTFEDCGGFINLCFEAEENGEIMDVVSLCFPKFTQPETEQTAWHEVIDAAARYLIERSKPS